MSKLNFFFAFLFISLGAAFYLAYFFSNTYVFNSTGVKVDEKYLEEEKNLFNSYETEDAKSEKAAKIEAEKAAKNVKLELLKSFPVSGDNFLGSDSIKLIFSEIVNLENIFGYKKAGDDGLIICKSGNKKPEIGDEDSGFMSRCEELSKVYLYEKGGEKEMFSGKISRGEENETTVILEPIPALESGKKYILEIVKGIVSVEDFDGKKIFTSKGEIIEFTTGTGEIVAGSGTILTNSGSEILEITEEPDSFTGDILKTGTGITN